METSQLASLLSQLTPAQLAGMLSQEQLSQAQALAAAGTVRSPSAATQQQQQQQHGASRRASKRNRDADDGEALEDRLASLHQLCTSNITRHRLRRELQAASEHIARHIAGGAPPGLLGQLQEQLVEIAEQGTTGVPTLTGPASARYKRRLEEALTTARIARPRQSANNGLSLRDEETNSSLIHELTDEEDGDVEDDGEASDGASTTAAPLDEFLEFSPTKPAENDPREVHLAYRLITDPRDGFAQAICFDLVPFLRRVYENIRAGKELFEARHQVSLSEADTRLMLGGGRCQSQKTPLKVVQILMCRLLGVATVVLTTGVSGREDLFKKFTTFLSPSLRHDSLYRDPAAGGHAGEMSQIRATPPPLTGRNGASPPPLRQRFRYVRHLKRTRDNAQVYAVELLPFTPSSEEQQRRYEPIVINLADLRPHHYDWCVEQLSQGACLVANNTNAAIDKVRNLIRMARGDPTMPFLQFVLTIDEADDFIRTDAFEASDIVYIQPSASYVGVEAFRCLQNQNGEDRFLMPNELTNRNNFCSRNVEAMYADAAGMQRSLLLDVTSPAVTAEGNIFTKAAHLLRLHPHAVAICVSGSEIWRRCGTGAQPAVSSKLAEYRVAKSQTGRNKVFQTILTEIDHDFPRSPIFVFGYSQMQRGISYRSSNRVPSHMILQFGKAMSLCRLVQAAGRANGKQAAQLMQNLGIDQPVVKLLTTPNDFDAICNYPRFLEVIRDEMETHSMTLQQALEATYDGRFDASVAREPGNRKAGLGEVPLLFNEVTDEELARDLPGARHQITQLPGLMHVLLRILLAGPGAVDPEDGMTTAQLLVELEASDYDLYMDGETREEMEQLDRAGVTAKIRSTLEAMNRSRRREEPLVDRTDPCQRGGVKWAITDHGEAVLGMRDEATGDSDGERSAREAAEQAAHGRRAAQLLCLEPIDNADEVAGPVVDAAVAGAAPSFVSVRAFPDIWVMANCLGLRQPRTWSLLYCPLIFLAASERDDDYDRAMTYWQERFSRYIPHYTATVQEEVAREAGIDGEVSASALATFGVGAVALPAGNPDISSEAPSYRSCSAGVAPDASSEAPSYLSLCAGVASSPAEAPIPRALPPSQP